AYRFLIAYESSPEMPGLAPPNPEQPVTRAEFVTWVARTLGLGPLARSPLVLLPVYTDLAGLTPEARNAANFLNALGLLKGGGRFRGDDLLTQAEGAAIYARLLQHGYPDGVPWHELPAPFKFRPWTEPIGCP
ncbi:MAG: S-layer homology domain-containing protein, partial [Mycobacterium leprae]